MDLSLKAKVILITGGASGIGASIAYACGREGAVPIIFDRDQHSIQKIQSELRTQGIEHKTVCVELTGGSTDW